MYQGKAEVGFLECCEPQTGHPNSLPYAEIPAPSTIYTTERRAVAEASHAPSSHGRNHHTELSLSRLAIVPSPLFSRGEKPGEGTRGKEAPHRILRALGSSRALRSFRVC